ncbi:MAG: hypothetical protein PVI26_01310 [Chitinispirillia bacterium]|jgi:hypothetical protein
MNHKKKKKKRYIIIHCLCAFSILISLSLCDSGLLVFKSHASYISQTEIELVVSENTDNISRDYLKAFDNQFWGNSDEDIHQDRFRDIIKRYNFLIRHLYKIQKIAKNPNQGTIFFLSIKSRKRLYPDNDQFLDV